MVAGEILDRVRDVVGVRQVFGDPYEKNGMVMVPVARVRGGGGGGNGVSSDEKRGSGWGGGFGLETRPVGVYVISDTGVTWRPALDVSRIALQSQVLTILALLLVARRRRRRVGGE